MLLLASLGRWIDYNRTIYRAIGKLLEKYNVEDAGQLATGGKYDVQDGGVWTNGVLQSLMNDIGLE